MEVDPFISWKCFFQKPATRKQNSLTDFLKTYNYFAFYEILYSLMRQKNNKLTAVSV